MVKTRIDDAESLDPSGDDELVSRVLERGEAARAALDDDERVHAALEDEADESDDVDDVDDVDEVVADDHAASDDDTVDDDAADTSGSRDSGTEGDSAPGEVDEPVPALAPGELRGAIEAILFSTSEPVTVRQLAEVLGVSVHDVREAVEDIRLDLIDTGRAFRLNEIGGGLQMMTHSRYHAWVSRFHTARKAQRLSPAAMETLSVIAYKQPISKADLESIRGVQCGPILKTLMDRGLIVIVGREESIGKPLLYGTSSRFLESFGLASLKHLPQPEFDAPEPRGEE